MDEARKAFEVWARGPAGYVDDQLARYADGSYQDSITLSHWAIWRAAWKAAAASGVPGTVPDLALRWNDRFMEVLTAIHGQVDSGVNDSARLAFAQTLSEIARGANGVGGRSE